MTARIVSIVIAAAVLALTTAPSRADRAYRTRRAAVVCSKGRGSNAWRARATNCSKFGW
jgi:hypothetical protein